MFWGLNLKANRKYTQKTDKSFHISKAVLHLDSAEDDGTNQIYVSSDNEKYLICTLTKGKFQTNLDLNFAEGDEITFQSIGSGNVTLSGYVIVPDMFNPNDEDEDSSDAEDSFAAMLNGAAAKAEKKANKDKKQKNTAAASNDSGEDEEDDDDEDDSDEDMTLDNTGELDAEDDDDEDDDDDDDEDDDDEEDDSDESEEEDVQPKAKQAKLENKQKQKPGKQQLNGADNKGAAQKQTSSDATPKEKKQEKKKEKKQDGQQKQQQNAAGSTKMLSGGVKIEEIRVGNGPEVTTGKKALVYYEGRLKSNNKVFDSLKSGSPFKFPVGRGEVIKGWDVGVVGMKVGGKRRITCPPHMAYGSQGAPPQIPPNSVLIFEVELKGVN